MNHISTPYKVIIAIPVLFVGGTEIHTLDLVKVLLSAGYRITLCCYYEFDGSMVGEMEAAGARVIKMGLHRADGIWNLITRLKTLFKELQPDIVHVQYIAPGLAPIIAAKLAKVPVIFATVHQPGRPYGLKERFLLRTASKLCTGFFCVSQSAERSWFGDSAIWDVNKARNGRKHFTIYNGVDCERVQASADSANANDLKSSLGIAGRPVVGVVGRLRAEKGHAWLLEAMADVVKVIPDVVLLVVGDGPDRESLKQKAANLGISENLIWMGQKLPEEVYRLYAVMDVVAVPSLFEGFGLTAAEAMAAGLPVVASSVEGLSEVVADSQTGYLLPPGNSKVLAEALVKLLKNPELRLKMGQRAHEVVQKEFSLAQFQTTILAAYAHYTEECKLA